VVYCYRRRIASRARAASRVRRDRQQSGFALGLGPKGEAHSARPRPAHLNLSEKDNGGFNLAFPPVLTGIIGLEPASVKVLASGDYINRS